MSILPEPIKDALDRYKQVGHSYERMSIMLFTTIYILYGYWWL